MTYNFQVNLRSIIDLLSNHLYSTPQIYLRELLQNAIDAIKARQSLDLHHQSKIEIQLTSQNKETTISLIFKDNGIGLTEEEIHQFLATIGQTSKDNTLEDTDFIGQFGIGLLSCFMVSDEIILQTRSIKEGSPSLEWRGYSDGTYHIQELEDDIEVGTSIQIVSKSTHLSYFEPAEVYRLLHHYGSILDTPIFLTVDHKTHHVNELKPPWQQSFDNEKEQKEEALDYGREVFNIQFLDALPIQSEVGEVEGIAYILPYAQNLTSKRTHRVYLKGLLLSEHSDNILPEWAFFVKCIINVQNLRVTASRESFYEDEQLTFTQTSLGICLRDYIINLVSSDIEKLKELISIHYLSFKALAIQDDKFYRAIIDWLPFETTLGEMTLLKYRQQHQTIQYIEQLDQFRQISHIAFAQSLCVINGSYAYDSELLVKFSQFFPDEDVRIIEASDITKSLEELSCEEQKETRAFLLLAEASLRRFKCAVQFKKFYPKEQPTLYSNNANSNFQRSLESSKEIADELWGSILNTFTAPLVNETQVELCLNYNNALIQKLLYLEDESLLERSLQMLYVQALLFSHQPLSSEEMEILNDGLLDLIELSIRPTQLQATWLS